MALNMSIDEWKEGIPQRELEQKIREYEEDFPKREKMTPEARANNQTRFFLEDQFYDLHKKQLADMLQKKAAEKQGVSFAGNGLDASALSPAPYGTTGGNGGQQFASGYGNGYASDYVQPVATANPSQRAVNGVQSESVRNNEDVSWDDYLKYAAAAALQGYTLGFSDELYGLGGALGAGVAAWRNGQNIWDEMKNGYVENRDDARAYLEEARECAPVVSAIAETGAGLVNPLGRFLSVGQKASRTAKIYNNMLGNTVTGTVYGAGQGEGDFMNQLASAERGAGLGMLTGKGISKLDRYLPMFTGPAHRIPIATIPISLGVNWGYDKINNTVLPAAGNLARPLFQDKNTQ